MVRAWRFSRTFASRFNFANVVFFLPATVISRSCSERGPTRHDGDPLSTVFRSAEVGPHHKRLATFADGVFGAPCRGVVLARASSRRDEARSPREARPSAVVTGDQRGG